jgi:hypothetical protein
MAGQLWGSQDRKLKARVCSILQQEVSQPEAIVVGVEGSQITLGGCVLASELADLLAAVEAVKGVQGILNHLEVYESVEDMPELPKSKLSLARLQRSDKLGIALGGVGLGLLAAGGFTVFHGRRKKNGLEALDEEPLRDVEQVPVQGTQEGTFQPETI